MSHIRFSTVCGVDIRVLYKIRQSIITRKFTLLQISIDGNENMKINWRQTEKPGKGGKINQNKAEERMIVFIF